MFMQLGRSSDRPSAFPRSVKPEVVAVWYSQPPAALGEVGLRQALCSGEVVSGHRQPAIDRQALPGHRVRRVRGEEDARLCVCVAAPPA